MLVGLEHIIIVIIIQIQMKNLAYIPTKTDKNRLYAELERQQYELKEDRIADDPIASE
jgi:hypothetical protein